MSVNVQKISWHIVKNRAADRKPWVLWVCTTGRRGTTPLRRVTRHIMAFRQTLLFVLTKFKTNKIIKTTKSKTNKTHRAVNLLFILRATWSLQVFPESIECVHVTFRGYLANCIHIHCNPTIIQSTQIHSISNKSNFIQSVEKKWIKKMWPS